MNKICLFLILAFITFAGAETPTKYLHISTNPSIAEVYINDSHPDHASSPDYNLPGFIPVPEGEGSLLVSIFRVDFADTLINVKLSDKDTSYLIVNLRPNYDEARTEKQLDELSHRSRRKVGHNLLFASIAPFLAGGISAAITAYEISQADDVKKSIDNSFIKEGEKYQGMRDDFDEYRSNAKTAKRITEGSLIAGGLILATGLILSF